MRSNCLPELQGLFTLLNTEIFSSVTSPLFLGAMTRDRVGRENVNISIGPVLVLLYFAINSEMSLFLPLFLKTHGKVSPQQQRLRTNKYGQ